MGDTTNETFNYKFKICMFVYFDISIYFISDMLFKSISFLKRSAI